MLMALVLAIALTWKAYRPREDVESESKVAMSPECHTAVEGEKCYSAVIYGMKKGVHEHPEWYPGLEGASFEAYQARLHRTQGKDCPLPCTKPVTLFCWTVIRVNSYEKELLTYHYKTNSAIFGCEEREVYSDQSVSLGVGFKTNHINVNLTCST